MSAPTLAQKTEIEAESLVELLFAPLTEGRAQETLYVAPHGNLVRKFDYQEFIHEVKAFARGMGATNLKRGCRVALLCRNSIKAQAAAFANLLNGYVNVVIPLDAGIDETLKALSSSRAECLIVDSVASAAPLLGHISHLPQLRQVVVLDEAAMEKHPQILCANWKELMERSQSQPDREGLLRQALTPDQEAFFVFQHDASRQLRGTGHTHEQLLEEAQELVTAQKQLFAHLTPKCRLLTLLPFSHPRAFILSGILPLLLKHSCMVLDPSETWKIESLTNRNTLLIAEPSFFESVIQKIEANLSKGPSLRTRLWQIACERGKNDLLGKILGRLLAPMVREQVGGRIFAAISTDALPSTALRDTYRGMGIPLTALDSEPTGQIGQQAGGVS